MSLEDALRHAKAARDRWARRLWWATLAYEGWMGYDGSPGQIPPPWYARHLARLNRWIDQEISDRNIGWWGPEYEDWSWSEYPRTKQSEQWR